ncbi:hypothetical protein PR003_g8976 [Phytophthora rubi]|uniref:DDE-1 domain-containing protein n=2 Tax=Phytophthora rubi TaxID=129364 RepID=A0A6A4F9L5_9STRA|nr:hypothetical protein PR001_g8239 [Phytophthora rubi]KAE9343464.1 hypothetical protein PR003_g8976 [Phytophthora rubi]
MRAHIAKSVKQRCAEKQIKMAVIPGGLTPYLQAGDVGIFKSFKDKMSVLIDEWKLSDQVAYTRGGNPRPPTIETVASWVASAWRQVPDDVVKKSVGKCGFLDDPSDWHISKHDVYGAKFRTSWELNGNSTVNSDLDEDTCNELLDAFDEVWIEE